jgi:hypothetical protein
VEGALRAMFSDSPDSQPSHAIVVHCSKGVWLKRHDCPHHIAWGWVGPSSGFCGTGERRESKRGEKRNLLKRKA